MYAPILRRNVWQAFALFVAWLCLLSLTTIKGAQAQETAEARGLRRLTVTGHGQVKIKPDKVDITIGVVTEDKSSQVAARANAAKAQSVQAVLRKAGIDAKDIQTVNYTVEPIYNNPPAGFNSKPAPPQIVGYRVYNQVRVKVRKLDALGDILDAVNAAGSNNVENIALGVDDQKAAEDEALDQAVTDARRKADRLARAAGTKILGIYELNDNSENHIVPRFAMAAQAGGFAGPSTPISSGELTVTANVTVVYQLSGTLDK